jgi:hypothetical protein
MSDIFKIETECAGADTICEYRHCKQEARFEMFYSNEDLDNGIAKHRCEKHKQKI